MLMVKSDLRNFNENQLVIQFQAQGGFSLFMRSPANVSSLEMEVLGMTKYQVTWATFKYFTVISPPLDRTDGRETLLSHVTLNSVQGLSHP